MIGEGGELTGHKVAPNFQPYTLTSTGEGFCKAHELAHPHTPSIQTLNANLVDCSQSSARMTKVLLIFNL